MAPVKFSSHLEASSYLSPGGGEVYKPLREKLIKDAIEQGYSETTMIEHGVVWADDQDPFGHVMNAGYSHYVSSCNFRLFESFEEQLGEKYNDLFKASGIGVMVKQFTVNMKRPVAYPDSLLVASKIDDVKQDRYHSTTTIWSLRQQAAVAESEGWVVFFDYTKGRPANLVEAGGVYKKLFEALSTKCKVTNEKSAAWSAAHPKRAKPTKL